MITNYADSNRSLDQLTPPRPSDFGRFIIIESGGTLLGLLFVLISYCLRHDYEFWHFLTLEIGIALITAVVVAGVVELAMSQREERKHEQHKQEIAESVFRALFGTAIPEELVKEMYTALFIPKFVREEIVIKYKFESLSAQPGLPVDARKLRVRQEIMYEARNIIDKPTHHSSTPREDILVGDDENSETPFKEFLMEIKGGDPARRVHLQTPEELAKNTSQDRARYSLKTQTLRNVKPGEVVRAVLRIDKICRYADTDTWVTSYPAKKLRLTVDVVGDPAPVLDFWVDQAHRHPMVPVPESERPMQRSYEWRLDHPILQQQGVMLRWRPKQSDPPSNNT